MSVFKRSDWNGLIDQVNNVITNPPPDTDCQPQTAIEHVGPNTIWKKSHIREVQEAIKATCDEIEFDPIPDKWKQSIVDEIQDKLGQAWCNCEDDDDDEPCDPEIGQAEDGLTYVIRELPWTVQSNCFGQTGDESTPVCDLIGGMQVASPGFTGRFWRLERHRSNTQNVNVIANGQIDCDGVVVCTTTATIPDAQGIYIGCGDCSNSSCVEALAAAQNGSGPTFTYKLVVSAESADCCEDEPTP